MSYRLASLTHFLHTRHDFLCESHTNFFNHPHLFSVWLFLRMSYCLLENDILKSSVWHSIGKSYRPLNLVWLNLVKSYLILTSSSSFQRHTHALPLFLHRVFQVFVSNNLLVTYFKPKKLAGYDFCSKISRSAAVFLKIETEFDWVRAIWTEFARVITGSVTLWPWIVSLYWFVVVLVQKILKPYSLILNFRVFGANLGIFGLIGD